MTIRPFPLLPAAALALLLQFSASAQTAPREVILTDPGYPLFHANAMDQPRLDVIISDNGAIIVNEEDEAVTFKAFVDTGSSGFVLSNLHVDPESGAGYLGLNETDYLGEYTNLGLGGEETGWVSRPLGVFLANQPAPIDGVYAVSDFVDYGEHRLWVRQQPGLGEAGTILGVSPVNIVGMPVIQQRVMVMEWKPIAPELADFLPENLTDLETKLLPPGDPAIPAANITLELAMRDFTGEPAQGEIHPSFARNPVVKNVTIAHDPNHETVTGDWLFDTGAGSTFISFDWAKTIGLIPDSYQTLDAYVVDHRAAGGTVSQVGGIGGDAIYVPVLVLNEIRIPAREGFDTIWKNAVILVFDHPELAALGIKGIFGMNLLSPAATIDASLLEGVTLDGGSIDPLLIEILLMMLSDISPSPFTSAAFEVTGEETAELRLFSKHALPPPTTFAAWREKTFTPAELTDENISGPAADPGSHGIPNLLRYAFGMNSPSPERNLLPAPEVVQIDGQKHLSLTYRQSIFADDLQYRIETSTDLVTWTPATDLIVESAADGNRDAITVRDPQPLANSPSRFLRLRVTAPPANP